MGEYVRLGNDHVKIGTCENLYYTTLAQYLTVLPLLKQEPNNSHVHEYLEPNEFRFRFPFPDEKHIKFGEHQDFDRGWRFEIPPTMMPTLHHHQVTMLLNGSGKKFSVSIPCPQVQRLNEVKYYDHDHTLTGRHIEITQQKIVQDDDGIHIATIYRCPTCHGQWRFSKEEAEELYAFYLTKETTDREREILNTMIQGYDIHDVLQLTEAN